MAISSTEKLKEKNLRLTAQLYKNLKRISLSCASNAM